MSQGTDEPHGGHDCSSDATTDSAGQPWAGRSFQPNPHAGDDGAADPALLAALEGFRSGEQDASAIVRAFADARVLIPLVAEKGEEGVGPTGLTVDKTQELSIVTVLAPDGRRILPVFSSVATLTAWDPAARPVPSTGIRAALAAAHDGTELIVIDPASETEHVLRRPAVWAIGRQQAWEPAHLSAEVFAGLQESVGTELAVIDLEVAAGDPSGRLRGAELIVVLHLVDGLAQAELDAVLSRLARRWAEDDRIAVLVDSLAVKLRRAA